MSDNNAWPKWKRDSVSDSFPATLAEFGFDEISDPSGTTVKRTHNKLSMYVSRGDADAMPQTPTRIAFKDVDREWTDEGITPCGCDMTERIWDQLLRGMNNATILFFLLED